jgi:hypothetical protein
VAQAKATVACPDGNECVTGNATSGSGSGSRNGGRSRSIQPLSAAETLSAIRIAAPTRVQSQGRLQEKPEIATAISSQTIPNEPMSVSPSKIGSSTPVRWSTTQLWME